MSVWKVPRYIRHKKNYQQIVLKVVRWGHHKSDSRSNRDAGNPEAKWTPCTLCHVAQTFPEQFLQLKSACALQQSAWTCLSYQNCTFKMQWNMSVQPKIVQNRASKNRTDTPRFAHSCMYMLNKTQMDLGILRMFKSSIFLHLFLKAANFKCILMQPNPQ